MTDPINTCPHCGSTDTHEAPNPRWRTCYGCGRAWELNNPPIEHTGNVITYQTASGDTIDVCTACDARLTAAHRWPKTSRGEEYASVSRGMHPGACEVEED